MTKYLRGNYEVDVTIEEPADGGAADNTEAFERKALSRLGGSICFVSKKGFLWKGDGKKGDGADGSGTKDRRPA